MADSQIHRVVIVVGKKAVEPEVSLYRDVIKSLEARGLRVWFASIWNTFPPDVQQVKLGTIIHRYGLGPLRFLLHKKLPMIFRSFILSLHLFLLYASNAAVGLSTVDPDVIVCEFSIESVFVLGRMCRRYPTVFRIYDLSPDPVLAVLEKKAFKACDVVATQTRTDALAIARKCGLTVENVYAHAPNTGYSPIPSSVPIMPPYWLYVSKRSNEGIQSVLRILAKRLPTVRIVMVGGSLLSRGDVPKNLVSLGWVSDRLLHSLYFNCAGILIPQFEYRTGVLNRFRDAVTYRKPTIITDAVRQAYVGLVSWENCVVAKDVNQMIDAITAITNDKVLAKKLARGVEDFHRDHLALDAEVEGLMGLMQKAVMKDRVSGRIRKGL